MGDIRKLLHFIRPYRRLALFSLAMLIAMVVLDLSIPRLVERGIDQGIRQKDMAVVFRTCAVMVGISLLSMIMAVLNSNSSIRVGESVARDVREAIFVKIQDFYYGNLDRFSTGTLMVRLTNDASAVQRLAQVMLRIGTRAPLSMLGSIVLMFVTGPTLALTMVPLLLCAGILIRFFSFRMEPLFRNVQQRLDRLNTVLQENIAGARLVKSFARADHENLRFGTANDDAGAYGIHQYRHGAGHLAWGPPVNRWHTVAGSDSRLYQLSACHDESAHHDNAAVQYLGQRSCVGEAHQRGARYGAGGRGTVGAHRALWPRSERGAL